jgi:hypothetical protein
VDRRRNDTPARRLTAGPSGRPGSGAVVQTHKHCVILLVLVWLDHRRAPTAHARSVSLRARWPPHHNVSLT